jgi:DNA-binding SARP family transcriptional activator
LAQLVSSRSPERRPEAASERPLRPARADILVKTLWKVTLLGDIRADGEQRTVTRFRTQKTAILFAYLAFYGQRAHPRETLIELLWPEAEIESGRNSLSIALSSLRNQFEPPGVCPGSVIVADRFAVRLSPSAVETDAAHFEATLDAAARTTDPGERERLLAQAVARYQGTLLPGFYEDWILREQERLSGRYLEALLQLAALREGGGRLPEAIDCARRAVSADPAREEAHRELMRLHALAGEPAAARRQYRHLLQALEDEGLGTPSAATRELARRIEAGEIEPRLIETARTPRVPAGVEPAAVDDLEPEGGAVPLGSPFYVVRPVDAEVERAIRRGDSIVLVKGPRQVGKTSLLARGLQHARDAGALVVHTDLQKLTPSQLTSAEALFFTLAETLAHQLRLEADPETSWRQQRGWNVNFERFLVGEVLASPERKLVWGLDEVDRLFTCDYSSEVFGLLRSWHNERALDPQGPFSRLTLAIAYATEAHLFITDINQSPFNVGTRLTLGDFIRTQVADLNCRYGRPLREARELERFHALLGGHPYLTRRGLRELARQPVPLAALEREAAGEEGPFGDHLRRLWHALGQDATLCEAMRQVLAGGGCPDSAAFYRLRSAGLVIGDDAAHAQPRCRLYCRFLEERLG